MARRRHPTGLLNFPERLFELLRGFAQIEFVVDPGPAHARSIQAVAQVMPITALCFALPAVHEVLNGQILHGNTLYAAEDAAGIVGCLGRDPSVLIEVIRLLIGRLSAQFQPRGDLLDLAEAKW